MANFWQKAMISLGLMGALHGVPAEAGPVKDSEKNKVENVSGKPGQNEEVNTAELRIFYKNYELGAREMIPDRFDSHVVPRNVCSEKSLDKYYHNAHYDPTMNAVVINQYHMSDENAYKRGLETVINASSVSFPEDFKTALDRFNNYLSTLKLATPIKKDGKTIKTYQGPKPQTLSDVQTILAQSDLFKPKDMESLKNYAHQVGLIQAIRIQDDITKLNRKNASKACVGHEVGHSEFEKVIKEMEKEGKFVEDLTPQDYFLLHMADEMTQYIHHDKKGMDPKEALNHFRADKESNYVVFYDSYSYPNTTGSATWKQWARQHMEIVQDKEKGAVVSAQSLDEKSQKFVDEVLSRVLKDHELTAVKNELNHLRTTQAYKDAQNSYEQFVKKTTVENVEYAKDEYVAISEPYLKKLHKTKEKADQKQVIKDGFFNNLVEVTDKYQNVIHAEDVSIEHEMAHAKGLIADKSGDCASELRQEAPAKTFVLTDQAIDQLNQSGQGR